MLSEPSVAVSPSQIEEPDRPRWTRYRTCGNLYICEATGASGVISGRWTDWRCDDDNTLWVFK